MSESNAVDSSDNLTEDIEEANLLHNTLVDEDNAESNSDEVKSSEIEIE